MSTCNVPFLMGKFEAVFPDDRRYCRNHMWCVPGSEGRHRFGLAAYAVRLLQEVYFLDWDTAAPFNVRERESMGRIESSKAESSLYAPLAGRVEAFNEALLKDPSAINSDMYGSGWLFEMSGDVSATLSAAEYTEFLAGEWKLAEKYLKGQVQ